MKTDPTPDSPQMLQPPRPAPRLLDDELSLLLDALPATSGAVPAEAVRSRLFERVARGAAARAALHTVRRSDAATATPAPGVRLRTLYEAAPGAALRRGEPLRVCWIELAPGARWSGPAGGWPAGDLQRDWLLVRGRAQVGSAALAELDYHVVPAGHAVPLIASEDGATLYLREAPRAAEPGAQPFTAAQDGADWADFAPGIRRRLLWTAGDEAAMLYHAEPGAGVPRHGHGHDEECLMLDGELFLDDVLLRPGEYQLAPAGSGHESLFTDTGVVIYAHGDRELALA